MIWTSQYLNELALEAEIQIAEEIPCIYDRYSFLVEQGISEYQLPEYVVNIIKITYKRVRLDPVSQYEYPDWIFTLDESIEGAFEFSAFTDAFNIGDVLIGNPQGKPERYFYSTFGENKLVLHPTPNENLAALSGDIWNSNLEDGIVVEFYRVPDGINWKLPHYIRRRSIKSYVMWKAFAKEGDGQNLKASKYWEAKYILLLQRAKLIISRIHQAETKTRSDAVMYQRGIIARPKLPWNWNVVTVDEYED